MHPTHQIPPALQKSPDAKLDTGIASLCFAANFHNVRTSPRELSHALCIGGPIASASELVLGAKILGIKAKITRSRWDALSAVALPSIAILEDGAFIVVVRAQSDYILAHDPRNPDLPRRLTREEFEAIWKGRMILLKPPSATTNTNYKFGFAWFIPLVAQHRKIVTEILIAAFVLQLFGLITPLISQVIFDKVIVHKSLSTLEVLGFGLLAIILFEAVLTIAQSYLLAHTSCRIDVMLGTKVYSHLMRLPLRYFETRRIGNTVAHLRELETIREFLAGSSLTAVLDVLFVGVFIAVMYMYSSALAVVVLASLPVFILLACVMRPLIRKRLDDKFDRGSESQSFLVESVSGAHTVKALSAEPIMQRKWEGYLARYASASFRTAHLGSLTGALGQAINRLAALAILYTGASLIMKGELTVGELIAFQMMTGRVINPVVRIVQLWQDFQQIEVSIERLGDIMDTPQEPASLSYDVVTPTIRGNVEFHNVAFRYMPDAEPMLKDLSFRVRAGEVVGVVGRSGSGKSTLTKLLQKMYQPETGKILVDGHNLRLADPTWLRRQIGVVLQDNFLFSGSILENISMHVPMARMEDIIRVAKLAGAHDFIMALEKGYDTQTGERGTALSGGQRQRIAIARALLTEPRILIFDEATSSLDYESERIIQGNLREICAGRTVFMIAHRLSTIMHADRILVMDAGAVVEEGTHHELLLRKGAYAHLFSQQSDSGDDQYERAQEIA